MLETDLLTLAERWPSLREVASNLRRLASHVGRTAAKPFFEPKSLFEADASNTRASLLALDGPMLAAWVSHIDHSCRVRMSTYEDGILSELVAGRLITSMTLLRAHLESAAKACLSLETLADVLHGGDLKRLEDLYQKTVFGTSLRKTAKTTPSLDEMLGLHEQETISACRAVEALDRFYYGAQGPGPASHLYSLLCEYAHPNPRGTRELVAVLDESPDGWLLQYSLDQVTESGAQICLESLLISMRAGYAATHVLRSYSFADEDGKIMLIPPSQADMRFAWTALLQREGPSAV